MESPCGYFNYFDHNEMSMEAYNGGSSQSIQQYNHQYYSQDYAKNDISAYSNFTEIEKEQWSDYYTDVLADMCPEEWKNVHDWIEDAIWTPRYGRKRPNKSIFLFNFRKIVLTLGRFMKNLKPELHHYDSSCYCRKWIVDNVASVFILKGILTDEIKVPTSFDSSLCWYAQTIKQLDKWNEHFTRLCAGISKRAARDRRAKKFRK